MRDLINIVEASLVPAKAASATGEVLADYAQDLNMRQAKEMLDSYPEGTAQHDAMDHAAFVCVNKYGVYMFYNPENDMLEHWDWRVDGPEFDDQPNGWSYLPSDKEFPMTNGGMNWWRRIRDGLEQPAFEKPALPAPQPKLGRP